LKKEAREAKAAYERAITERSSSQRQMNDLLQRKNTWNEEDVTRFTALVRHDHLNEQEEVRAKERADHAEYLSRRAGLERQDSER
jgi:sensitive to high expression protein 9, mitochondrial